MKGRKTSMDDSLHDQALPIPIQIFLWRQISPFIRPKLGKLHEASCMVRHQTPQTTKTIKTKTKNYYI